MDKHGRHLDEYDVIIDLHIDAVGADDGVRLLPVRRRLNAGPTAPAIHSWIARQEHLQKSEVLRVVCAHRKHHLCRVRQSLEVVFIESRYTRWAGTAIWDLMPFLASVRTADAPAEG